MGTLFEDSDEYPDYIQLPQFTARIDGVVVPLAIAATLYGICPVVLEEHGQHSHVPHEEYQPVHVLIPMSGVSSSTGTGSVIVTPPAGKVGFTGYAPTIRIT